MGVLRKRTFFQTPRRDPIEDLAKYLYNFDTYLTPWEEAAEDLRRAFIRRAQGCAIALLGDPYVETAYGVRMSNGRVYSGYSVPQETVRGDESFSYTVTKYPRLTIMKENPHD